MVTAKVIGAGSIGNHLSHALRTENVDVTIVDVDPEALERAKNVIYPERYGEFDRDIRLAHPSEVGSQPFDLCVIGTPPDNHLPLASAELSHGHRLLLIEKPLAPSGRAELDQFAALAASSPTRVLVAYNQRLKPNSFEFLHRAQDEELGSLVSISGRMREDWAGILEAHPWLADATQSYLGYTHRGGGALYEHSHATDFALFIAYSLGQGRPVNVRATLDVVEHDTGSYDKAADVNIKMSSGLTVDVVQDLVTWPPDKSLVAKFANGAIRWEMHGDHDLLRISVTGKPDETVTFPKTRPDDFLPEIRHVLELLEPSSPETSPLDLSEALYTSWALEAALESRDSGDWVSVRGDASEYA